MESKVMTDTMYLVIFDQVQVQVNCHEVSLWNQHNRCITDDTLLSYKLWYNMILKWWKFHIHRFPNLSLGNWFVLDCITTKTTIQIRQCCDFILGSAFYWVTIQFNSESNNMGICIKLIYETWLCNQNKTRQPRLHSIGHVSSTKLPINGILREIMGPLQKPTLK